MEGCVFCGIATGKVPARIVHEDDQCVAFRDINPQAPVHVLIIPREHLTSLNDGAPENERLLGRLLTTAAAVAKTEGIDGTGYRTVINTNAGAGQTVFHIHVHLLGGRIMRWPPG